MIKELIKLIKDIIKSNQTEYLGRVDPYKFNVLGTPIREEDKRYND